MAWGLVLFFLPIVGLVFYFFFGRSTRKAVSYTHLPSALIINARLLILLEEGSWIVVCI